MAESEILKLQDVNIFAAHTDNIGLVQKALKSKKKQRFDLYGLAGSAPAMLLAALNMKRPGIVVADDFESAGYLYNDLVHCLDDNAVAIFPSAYKRDIKYGQIDAPAQILRTETLEALRSSASLKWVVTSPEALAERVPAREVVDEDTLNLHVGDRITMSRLRELLLEKGFRKEDYVYEPGQFAMRGSIVDIFSFSKEYPVRIDFFDDEIDTIRFFDVQTQLSREQIKEMAIVFADSDASRGISLPEFVGSDTPLFLTDPEALIQRVKEITGQQISEAVDISGEGDADAMKNVVNYDEFIRQFEDMKQFVIHAASAENILSEANRNSVAIIDFDCAPQTLYHKNFDLISKSFTDFCKDGYKIYILSDTPYQGARLRSIFEDRGDDIKFQEVMPTLHAGFIDRQQKVCYFTDHQIFDRFHKYSLRSDKARGGKLALTLKELSRIETGDYIVHIDHGIGRFGGLVKTDVNGHPQEMIKLLYQNDDMILVSIHALHKLSKYRGKDGIPPKVNKLGTGAWQRLKERTKTKVKDIARDLIELYAKRREEKGFQFSADSYMQQELEASFIYEDTPDQILANRAIKEDMESTRPMDRLVCGDVGFGKTELAIRAAFKAAADNKQTAVLVPTTVLAMQHYHTFSARLKDMPVKVEFLSRAKKPKEVKQILADLEAGNIDIIIGTHKLIGKNVKFHDLGLLIVDEEQKFGVSVKERLKQLKTNVDTLTLSATPIPRTLQFSLMGARDLSSLNTAPANRRPVATNITTFSDDVIAEAINFEVSRNGQIFFISHRIERLHQIRDLLRKIVPGVKVVVAHGQMPPEELEKAILDFQAHDYDILLSTTIVENGIDMPNVNTILIDNAQNFGLSELHQLRGRVGRSSRKAFCYLLTPPGYPLTPVARRRLQAIENFSDLGSGIHIAMQDLDIRGAGNLLGAEQSGFIADLGYETYQKILKEAVIELKTEEFADSFDEVNAGKEEQYVADCTIESDLELRLPPDYVPLEGERIALYQQLDNMETQQQVDQFREHLIDRFGKIPYTGEELIRVVPMRMLARRLGIERLVLKNKKMRLYFVSEDNAAYYKSEAFGRVLTYLQKYPLRCEISKSNTLRSIIISDVKSVSQALDILNEMLS